jgi:hypothetical protein
MTCLECQTSSTKLCPLHALTDNHMDDVDQELEQLRAERDRYRLALERIVRLYMEHLASSAADQRAAHYVEAMSKAADMALW